MAGGQCNATYGRAPELVSAEELRQSDRMAKYPAGLDPRKGIDWSDPKSNVNRLSADVN
jgi:hypothetical protein